MYICSKYEFNDYDSAASILAKMVEAANAYGYVTFEDFLDLIDVEPTYAAKGLRWSAAEVKSWRLKRLKSGWLIIDPHDFTGCDPEYKVHIKCDSRNKTAADNSFNIHVLIKETSDVKQAVRIINEFIKQNKDRKINIYFE